MTKLPRDAKAFARRVRIGSHRLWFLVEGRVHDLAYYDRLLEATGLIGRDEYSLRLVELIALKKSKLSTATVNAGGKEHVYALHTFYKSHALLAQVGKEGSRFIAFAADRDFESFGGRLRQNEHLFYTDSTDVESEIFLNGNIQRAIASTYSLDRASVEGMFPVGRNLLSELAWLWREWITLGVIAHAYQIRGVNRFGSPSEINVNLWGPVDRTKADEIKLYIQSQLGNEITLLMEDIRAEVDAIYDSGEEAKLVKGKWLPNFVLYLLKKDIPSHPLESNIHSGTLCKVCLETLDFQSTWTSTFKSKLQLLLQP